MFNWKLQIMFFYCCFVLNLTKQKPFILEEFCCYCICKVQQPTKPCLKLSKIKTNFFICDFSPFRSHIGALWLKNVIQIHAGLLLSNPELPDLLGATVGSIQNRLTLHMPLSSLRGRLDLLVSQISSKSDANNQSQEDEAMLVYNDTGTNICF